MKNTKKKPNILILITDQQRSIQHFPEGWAEKYLPWTTHLKKTGVTFKNNMCSSTTCSPSRSTIFSGTYPTVNGVLKVNDTINMSRTLPMGGSLATLDQAGWTKEEEMTDISINVNSPIAMCSCDTILTLVWADAKTNTIQYKQGTYTLNK